MTQPSSTLEQPRSTKFNSSDRCDACGSQAYAAATFTGGDLLFCGHHYRKYQAALEQQALAVIDNTDDIASK